MVKQLKIKDLKNTEPLKDALRVCRKKVGSTHEMDSEERQIIIDYIKRKYSNLYPEEIKQAFDLAIDGVFEYIEPRDLAPLKTRFTQAFLSQVMGAYLQHKIKLNPPKTDLSQLEEKIMGEFDRKKYYQENLFDKYQLLLEGKYTWNELDEWHLYKSLKGLGIDIELPEKRIQEYAKKKENLKGNRFQPLDKQQTELKDRYMREAFRTWVTTKAENLEDIKTEILNKL